MDILKITGGTPLIGEVFASPAKNAAVAIVPACVLADGPCEIDNIPNITDIDVEFEMLKQLGATVEKLNNEKYRIDCTNINTTVCSLELAKKLRASYYFMGALLGKSHKITTSLPGGCPIGNRADSLGGIDFHIKGFEAMGAHVSYRLTTDEITIEANELIGTEISLEYPSVGATINIMLAAAKAKGKTVIHKAAKEPHVVSVAEFLNKMGADIRGAGTGKITIKGVEKLKGADFEIIPDQIETGTYMVMAAATKGDVTIKNAEPRHMEAVTTTLRTMNVGVEELGDSIRVFYQGPFRKTNVTTEPYPGFPTDMQPIITTLLSLADGMSTVTETVTEDRFRYVDELKKMGANIMVSGDKATIEGTHCLHSAEVSATDLRAGAALVIAALVAEGTSEITNFHHIARGYEKFVEKITAIGGKIEKVKK